MGARHCIGETFTAYNGMKFTIVNIDRTLEKPFTIQFENGYIVNIGITRLKNGAEISNGDSVCSCTLFGIDYKSLRIACKHFGISYCTIKGKSSTEIEDYIANNRIEYNGHWVNISNYVAAYGVTPRKFYNYLEANGIEKNAANAKSYIAQYLETAKNKVEMGNVLKIINNYFGTSFKSLKDAVNHFGLSSSNLYLYTGTKESLIKYIKKHSIQYGGQWISIKSYCEKLGVKYNSLATWAKTKCIRINASNITDIIKSYRNAMTIESEQQRVCEMQKLEQLIKRYITLDICTVQSDKIYAYFSRNNLSAEQVIVHFRPDLHINIFGKIVDENGNEV